MTSTDATAYEINGLETTGSVGLGQLAGLGTGLNGTILVTGVTAVGQYTASTFSLSATSITLFLNN